MAEKPPKPRRTGLIDGEPMPLVSSHIDTATGTLRMSIVQRGSMTVERVQAMMARELVTIQMPDASEPIRAIPESIDVSSTGSGGRTLYRMDLTLRLPPDEETQSGKDAQASPAASLPDDDDKESLDMAVRLERIETKLDRILSLLERDDELPRSR